MNLVTVSICAALLSGCIADMEDTDTCGDQCDEQTAKLFDVFIEVHTSSGELVLEHIPSTEWQGNVHLGIRYAGNYSALGFVDSNQQRISFPADRKHVWTPWVVKIMDKQGEVGDTCSFIIGDRLNVGSREFWPRDWELDCENDSLVTFATYSKHPNMLKVENECANTYRVSATGHPIHGATREWKDGEEGAVYEGEILHFSVPKLNQRSAIEIPYRADEPLVIASERNGRSLPTGLFARRVLFSDSPEYPNGCMVYVAEE